MTDYIRCCERHLQRLIAGTAHTGGALWPSVLDVRTGRYPAGDHCPRRVYRLIGAPRGSTLYWDQPMVVAAEALTERTGKACHGRAAREYLDTFLSHCIADNGMFRWGNHQYYDVFEQKHVAFSNGHHELRPITPAWELFWERAPERTASYIRALAERHVYDAATGGFNRHDDGRKGHAFLEAGGILCESLAWLFGKTGDRGLADAALRIARYSYRQRNGATGLVPNEPDMGRWDAHVCTSEIGLWARCLIRAADYTDMDEFVAMARAAVRAYLEHAVDPDSGSFWGQVSVADGRPVIPRETGYWPRRYSNPWNTDQWPTHDYPMPAAEACLSLHALTGDRIFRDSIRRWAEVVMRTRPGRTGGWAYAESYGRCIHFLDRASVELDEHSFLVNARLLADEAMDRLFEHGMFQGYPGGHLYESVDGVGFLILALMGLDADRPMDLHGLGF